jgi:hypothetical protein
MSALAQLSKRLRPGRVYRRKELAQWSTSVDRHLKQLLEKGRLEKVSGGLYMAPRETRFGKAPASDAELVAGFLGDDRFLLVSPNAYNGLGVGATQLYNVPVVYNHKRHGLLRLDGRTFEFRRRMSFPKTVSEEFLLVDLLHNLASLAEDTEAVRGRALRRAETMDRAKLERVAHEYDSARARRLLEPLFADDEFSLAA